MTGCCRHRGFVRASACCFAVAVGAGE